MISLLSSTVPLANCRLVARVSESDLPLVSPHSWNAMRVNGKTYARTKVGSRSVLMHRLLLDVNDPQVFVDHRDGDGLNNARDNIRIATPAQNRWNAASRSKSGFRGVSELQGKWIAKWHTKGEYRYAGYWPTAIEAALAYNDLIRSDRGQHGEMNKVPVDQAIEILEQRLSEANKEVERIRRWMSGLKSCS
jgi:hypothetical protein